MPSEATAPQPQQRIYAETEDGATVILQTRRHTPYKWRFLTMFCPGATTIAQLDRPAAYYRTLLACMAMMDSQQMRRISAREIAVETGLATISVERALAMLQADGVLVTNGQKGPALARRLTNRLCWTSRADAHAAATPDPEVTDARGR